MSIHFKRPLVQLLAAATIILAACAQDPVAEISNRSSRIRSQNAAQLRDANTKLMQLSAQKDAFLAFSGALVAMILSGFWARSGSHN